MGLLGGRRPDLALLQLVLAVSIYASTSRRHEFLAGTGIGLFEDAEFVVTRHSMVPNGSTLDLDLNDWASSEVIGRQRRGILPLHLLSTRSCTLLHPHLCGME